MSRLKLSLANPDGSPNFENAVGFAADEKIVAKLSVPYSASTATLHISPNITEFSQTMAMTVGKAQTYFFDLEKAPSQTVVTDEGKVQITLIGVTGSVPRCTYEFEVKSA